MPIRWSALKVNEAADMVEEYISQAAEPLEQARLVARAALEIPNLPGYVAQHLGSLIDEVNRIIGGGRWGLAGRFRSVTKSIRDSLPEEAIKEERRQLENGRQLSLTP